MMDQWLPLLQSRVAWILPLIFAITVHEVAHGWVAKRYGDNTASMLGRLTLNPIKHIDIVGTIILPGILLLTGTGFIFGWAKPVPVDIRNFKNPLSDMAVVALAGPVANLLMALGWTVVLSIGIANNNVENIAPFLIQSGKAGIEINLGLALLNLLPIPPLDGSRILTAILPSKLVAPYNQLERFGFVILLVLLNFGLLNSLLGYPKFFLQNWLFSLAGFL